MSDQAELDFPSQDELDDLGRWQCVALAVQCAVYSSPFAGPYRETSARRSTSVDMAKQICVSGIVESRATVRDAIDALDLQAIATRDFAAEMEGNWAAVDQGMAQAAALWVVVHALESCIDETPAAALSKSIARLERGLHSAHYSTSRRYEIVLKVREDLKRLRDVATPDDPVPSSFFD